MPLVRLQVRNEFGLGQPELYRETKREDPKAVLDGVAVAGLVGILRQLGDLADFAAEVFHGLQEQVMTTASRSHKLTVRVENVEASLPPLEKAILAQTSHIHFAYTAGCEWHHSIKAARNHFIYDDLPQFIMDSYEECREPPRVHLLDKFDTGGPGACLRRYSDPTFFKRVSAVSDESYFEKSEKARKSRKKKRSSRRNGELLQHERRHSSSGRMQFISPTVNGRTSSQTASTVDIRVKSDLEDHSNSFDSRADTGYIECVFHPSNPILSAEQDCEEPSSSRSTQKTDTLQSVSPHADDNISHDYLEKQIACNSPGVTWDEKEEIVEVGSEACDRDKTPERVAEKQDRDTHPNEAVTITNTDYNDIIFDEEGSLKPVSRRVQMDDIDSEPDNYMDALNTIESECENDLDYETKREVEPSYSCVTHGIMENGVPETTSNLSDRNLSDVVYQTGNTVSLNKETASDFPDSLLENLPLISEPHPSNLGSASLSDVPASEEMTNDTVSLSNETLTDSSDLLYEIPSLSSESHALNLGSGSPSDVTASEETTGDTFSLNKETVRDLPVSMQKIPPASSQPHVDVLLSPSSDFLVSKEIEKDLAGSHFSESAICEQVAHACGNSVLDCTVCTHSFNHDADTVNGTETPAMKTNISFSGSETSNLPDEEADKINSNICNSEGTPNVSSGDHSVRFWTNGGLLGLEPSKPPDFTMSSSLSPGPLNAKSENDGDSSCNSMQKSTALKGVCDLSEDVAEHIPKDPCSRCLTEDGQACIPVNTYGIPRLSNKFSQTERKNLGEIRVIAPRSVLPAAPEAKAGSERHQGNAEKSSRVSGISHRLLITNVQRKVSFDEKSGPYYSLKSSVLEQSGQHNIVQQSLPEMTFKESVGSGYPIDSLPPSPPLEHMKISFHPVSGLETSKLKLKFPDGNNHHESIRDMFPSFQLVPEPSVPLDDSGFHSDDADTFCRSSSESDDCLSTHCNSDQWESDEAPDSSDHGVYDSPHGRSSSEPISNTKEHGGMSKDDSNVACGHGKHTSNGVEPSLSGPLLDFPSFDNVNTAIEQESSKHSECNDVVELHSHAELTPPPLPPPRPPPLPPMQWKTSKLQLNMTNGTQHCMSEDAEHISDLSLPESTSFQQPRLTEVEQTQINHYGHESPDNILHKSEEKLDRQKLNGHKEGNHMRMGKETDEREDFLQQIRTKSFNLRHTVKEKPNATTVNTTNVKVTAILEKANAIRQVVASDDGEDDENWSDT